MEGMLSDLRIVEAASFVPGPMCGLMLARMGAEVIRIDPIGGGPDIGRWPLAPGGRSLYWEGLNKGKKSVSLDLKRPEGRELAVAIATAPGEGRGLLVTNTPVEGFLAHAALAARRPDMVSVRITGWGDGSPAADATVNVTLGIPLMTGPETAEDTPVNHVIPVWDLASANHAAFALLAAERRRRMTGEGAEIRVALGDVALAALSDLGLAGEVELSGVDRARMGNQLFGGFGRDFETADKRRVLILALSRRHWRGLVEALSLVPEIDILEKANGVDFGADESARFAHREALNAVVGRAVARLTLPALSQALEGSGACWAPYNRLSDIVGPGRLVSIDNPLFFAVEHPSGQSYATAGAPATLAGAERVRPGRAPDLGENTDEVLADVVGLSSGQIARLHDQGLAAGPARDSRPKYQL